MFNDFPRKMLLIAAATLFAPCTQAGQIGLLLKGKSAFWAEVEAGAQRANGPLGHTVLVKTPPTEADVAAQVLQFKALVSQGVQGIVVAPNSSDALIEPVREARSAGIHVVVIDTALAQDVAAAFVGTDQRAAGGLGGALLAKYVQDGAKVCIFKHSQTNTVTTAREVGAMEALRVAHGSLVVTGRVYASGDQPGVEMERARMLLDQTPEVNGIFVSATPGTLAMLGVLRERGLTGKIPLVGFGFNLTPDVAAAIESGEMTGWVAQRPAEVGALGIKAMDALMRGETVPKTIRTAVTIVTKENLKSAEVQELLLE